MSKPKGENSAYFQDGRVRTGQHYALMPEEVMQSEAYRGCPDYAARVLLALAAAFRKTNNGDLSLTAPMAEGYGIREWKLRAGLAILESIGLIERMRVGNCQGGKPVCSLYALGWRQIDPSDDYDQPLTMAMKAPNRWAKWTAPDNWASQVKAHEHRAKGKRSRYLTMGTDNQIAISESAGPEKTRHPAVGAAHTPHVRQEQPLPHPAVGAGKSVSRTPQWGVLLEYGYTPHLSCLSCTACDADGTCVQDRLHWSEMVQGLPS